MRALTILAVCLGVAVVVYLVSGGRIFFLPLLLVLPLGLFARRGRR